MDFDILGKTVRQAADRVETFPVPAVTLARVTMRTEEFTSTCPVTGQPDFGAVTIEYLPATRCIESKSLKLYLWKFREAGVFCEALSTQILQEVQEVVQARYMKVTVEQRPRGGVGITAVSEVWKGEEGAEIGA